MIADDSPPVRDRLAALLAPLGGRAAGYWRLDGEVLTQIAFVPAATLDPETAVCFAEATRSVPLSRVELGIVRAAVSKAPFVAIAEELPADLGSGLWLRNFKAPRSVSVPFLDDEGRVVAVVAVALPGPCPDDRAVIDAIRAAWSEGPRG